jgi:hypothetical protein
MSDYKTTALLALALVVFNRKDIVTYVEWLHFKILTYHKQRANERKNNTSKRSREIHCKRAFGLQK